MYFPYSSPRVAENHLMAWIKRCQPIKQQLMGTGYQNTSKGFTPRQVKIIVEHLGEP